MITTRTGVANGMMPYNIHTATGTLSFYNQAYTIDDPMLVWCLRLWTFTGKYSAVQANVKQARFYEAALKALS